MPFRISPRPEKAVYAERARALRAPCAVTAEDLRLRALVRCATLAPSSHNTQCWRFGLERDAIRIAPDLARRCPAVDPDDHHLFASLGCALENLLQAAPAFGLSGQAAVDPESGAIRVALHAARQHRSALCTAIPQRQTTRAPFDGRALSADVLEFLARAGSGDGVRLLLITRRSQVERVLEHILAASAAQTRDPAFVAELREWIRFSYREALVTGDGLFAPATGNPALPGWLGAPMFELFYRPGPERSRTARLIRSSAGLAAFVSERDDKRHWVEAGRCYERFALQATSVGIRNALVNQPVEVAAQRRELASELGLASGRVDLLVRFGCGPRMPASLRRPLEAVLR
jgi:hypothetical protein